MNSVSGGATSTKIPATKDDVLLRQGVLLRIVAQLALAAAAVLMLEIQTLAFQRVFCFALLCSLVNMCLPRRFRLAFFVAACVGAVLLVLGGTPQATWDPVLALQRTVPMLLAGALLIWICLLPVGFWWRVLLLAAAGCAIGLMRANLFGPDGLLVIWPILASMFMFRVMIFLYDVSTSKERPKLGQMASYFAMVPNSASLLFPLVDYKTMTRSYYNADALGIYERGARWIVRGVVQLVLFRLVQQLVSIEADRVSDGTEVIQYVVSTTFIYLQVSGLFHVLIGTMLLFGFNLPEVNRRYFLASSFTDYLRRVNIYWKDFILKVFYYPAYFRLKALGATRALVLATLWSFFITWALHLYQTWWLKGQAPLRSTDVIFWSMLALLVLANSLWEMTRGRERKLGGATYTLRSALGLMLRTAGTFAIIAILWSLWNVPTVAAWLNVWSHADGHTAVWAAAILVAIMAAKWALEILPSTALWKRMAEIYGSRSPLSAGSGALMVRLAPLLLIVVVAHPLTQQRLHHAYWQPWFDAINTTDAMMDNLVTRNRGYYEALSGRDYANLQLWQTLSGRSHGVRYDGPDPSRPTDDFRGREALPNVSTHAYYASFQTNSFGMRDREYPLYKDDDTVRIALLGSSHTMGWGVEKRYSFEEVLERRLNEELGGNGTDYEVLNFAFNRWSPFAQTAMCSRVARFHPDIVMQVAHSTDFEWNYLDYIEAIRRESPLNDPLLEEIAQSARLTWRTHPDLARWRLEPYWNQLLDWSYGAVVSASHEMGAEPIAVLMPTSTDYSRENGKLMPEPLQGIRASLLRAGFDVIDLTYLYERNRLKVSDVVLTDGFAHTNVLGHRLIADALFDELVKQPVLARAGESTVQASKQSSVRKARSFAKSSGEVVKWINQTSKIGSRPTSWKTSSRAATLHSSPRRHH